MEKNGGVGENTHELEKNAKMLEKINTIIRILNPQTSFLKLVINPYYPILLCEVISYVFVTYVE